MSGTLTLVEASRIMADATQDKSYMDLGLGPDVATYLARRHHELAPETRRRYESVLDKLARHFAHLTLEDFEPPVGTDVVERFLVQEWGGSAPETYNAALVAIHGFFDYWTERERLHRDPTRTLKSAKKRESHKPTPSSDEYAQLLAGQPELRDRLAIRLMGDYGLRKDSLRRIQFKHFDHARRRLTVFLKGGKVREKPIPQRSFWFDLEHLILEVSAEPDHYLMWKTKVMPRWGTYRFPDTQLGKSGMHNWFNDCCKRAGLQLNMHALRRLAGQKVLDATGDIKLTQQWLDHEDVSTTAKFYVNYDAETVGQKVGAFLGE